MRKKRKQARGMPKHTKQSGGVGPVIRMEDVSLRRPKSGARRMAAFRLPADVFAYFEIEAAATGRDKTAVVVEAIYLDRDLGRRLAQYRERLEVVAAELGLSLEYDLAEVISKTVERGLEAYEVTGSNRPHHLDGKNSRK